MLMSINLKQRVCKFKVNSRDGKKWFNILEIYNGPETRKAILNHKKQ